MLDFSTARRATVITAGVSVSGFKCVYSTQAIGWRAVSSRRIHQSRSSVACQIGPRIKLELAGWAVLAAPRPVVHPARPIPLTSGLLINPQHCRTRVPSSVFCFLRPKLILPHIHQQTPWGILDCVSSIVHCYHLATTSGPLLSRMLPETSALPLSTRPHV